MTLLNLPIINARYSGPSIGRETSNNRVTAPGFARLTTEEEDDDIKFSGASSSSKMSQAQATSVADSLISQGVLDRAGKHNAIQVLASGKALKLKQPVLYGFVQPNGTVLSPDEEFKQIVAYLLKSKGVAIPAEGISLVIDKGAAQHHGHDDDKDPTQQFLKAIGQYYTAELKDEKNPQEKSTKTVLWPALHSMISGDALPQGLTASIPGFDKKLADLPLYQIKSASHPETAKALNDQFANSTLRRRLIGLELADKHYMETETSEIMMAVGAAVAIGLIGETAIEHMKLGNGPFAGLARTGLIGLVDLVDNVLGLTSFVQNSFKEQGIKTSPFKPESYKNEAAKRIGVSAIKDALVGTAMGTFLAVAVGDVLSGDHPVLARTIIGGGGAIGTSLSKARMVQSSIPQFEKGIQTLILEGKIPMAKGTTLADYQGDKLSNKQARNYVRDLAMKEFLASPGNSMPNRGFSIAWLASGAILALEKLGVPRNVVQKAYMMLSPGMENMITLAFIMRNLKHMKKQMHELRGQVLAKGDSPFTSDERKNNIDKRFIDGWSKRVADFMLNAAFNVALGALFVGFFGYFAASKLLGKHKKQDAQLQTQQQQAKAMPSINANPLPQAVSIQPPHVQGNPVLQQASAYQALPLPQAPPMFRPQAMSRPYYYQPPAPLYNAVPGAAAYYRYPNYYGITNPMMAYNNQPNPWGRNYPLRPLPAFSAIGAVNNTAQTPINP